MSPIPCLFGSIPWTSWCVYYTGATEINVEATTMFLQWGASYQFSYYDNAFVNVQSCTTTIRVRHDIIVTMYNHSVL